MLGLIISLPYSADTVLVIHVLSLFVEATLLVLDISFDFLGELFFSLFALSVTSLVFSPVLLEISDHSLGVPFLLFNISVKSLRDGIEGALLVSLTLGLDSKVFGHTITSRGGHIVTTSGKRDVGSGDGARDIGSSPRSGSGRGRSFVGRRPDGGVLVIPVTTVGGCCISVSIQTRSVGTGLIGVLVPVQTRSVSTCLLSVSVQTRSISACRFVIKARSSCGRVSCSSVGVSVTITSGSAGRGNVCVTITTV